MKSYTRKSIVLLILFITASFLSSPSLCTATQNSEKQAEKKPKGRGALVTTATGVAGGLLELTGVGITVGTAGLLLATGATAGGSALGTIGKAVGKNTGEEVGQIIGFVLGAGTLLLGMVIAKEKIEKSLRQTQYNNPSNTQQAIIDDSLKTSLDVV